MELDEPLRGYWAGVPGRMYWQSVCPDCGREYRRLHRKVDCVVPVIPLISVPPLTSIEDQEGLAG